MSNKSETIPSVIQCNVTERWREANVIISCVGVIDMLTAPNLERHIGIALNGKPAGMIVDLTRVDFLASAGMGILIAAQELCADAVTFAVVADGPLTRRPMQLVGVTDILTVHDSLDDALHALDA